MFRLFFFISYLPLLIYIYLRCKKLFITTLTRRAFALLFIFFALAFPVLDFLGHQIDNSSLDVLIQIGFYTQPYLLYLLFSVLLSDLGHLLFRFQRRQWPVIVFIFLFPLLIVIGGAWKFNHIVVNSYSLSLPARETSLKNLRVVFAADFHLRGHSELKALREFVEKSNALKPDLVLLPGDIIEGDRHNEEMPEIEEAFRQLKSTYGTFAVFGNHETYGQEISLEFYKKANITLLRDQIFIIKDAITLVGRDDLRLKTRKDFSLLEKEIPTNLPIIMLDHRPNDFKKVSLDGIDIQVSGHTHHGQIFPFNFITKAMYDLSYGVKQIGRTHFFVTSGLRGWGPQVRTSGDAELVKIDIEFKRP